MVAFLEEKGQGGAARSPVGVPAGNSLAPRSEGRKGQTSYLRRRGHLQPVHCGGQAAHRSPALYHPLSKLVPLRRHHRLSRRRVREDGGPEDKCSFIGDCEGQPASIYPYRNYVHRANGALDRRLFTASRWELTRVLRQAGQTKLKPGNEFGVKTLVEWQRHIVPEVPLFIRAFCECFNIFREERIIQRLRPMLYTYWS